MSDLKSFYLNQIENGWQKLESKISSDKNGRVGLILEYVSNSLSIAEEIGARKEAMKFFERKIKRHRASLDEYLQKLEVELSEKQKEAGEISRLQKFCGITEKRHRRAHKENTVKQPRREIGLEKDADDKYSYEELQKQHAQLTPDYINKVKLNKQHNMLKGSGGHVTEKGLGAWEAYFKTHGHYDDLVDSLIGIKPEEVKHSAIKNLLCNIGGKTKAAIWTYALDNKRKIEERLYAKRKHRQAAAYVPPSLDQIDKELIGRLNITSYGLARLKKEGLLSRHHDEYNKNDVRIIRDNFEERKLIDDEAAYLCAEHQVDPQLTEKFIEKVYEQLQSKTPGTLESCSINKFGNKAVFIYNTLHCSPEKLRETVLNPLLKEFIESKK